MNPCSLPGMPSHNVPCALRSAWEYAAGLSAPVRVGMKNRPGLPTLDQPPRPPWNGRNAQSRFSGSNCSLSTRSAATTACDEPIRPPQMPATVVSPALSN